MDNFRLMDRRLLWVFLLSVGIFALSIVSWLVPTWSVAITVMMLAGVLWAIVLMRSADDHAG